MTIDILQWVIFQIFYFKAEAQRIQSLSTIFFANSITHFLTITLFNYQIFSSLSPSLLA